MKKKKILILIITAALVFVTTACGMFKSTTQKYMEALSKTQTADSLQVQTRYTMAFDLSKANESAKKDLEKFKEVSADIDQWIDNKDRKSETRSFIKAGDIMYDSRIYGDSGKVYMKSSLFGDKYIDLTAGESRNTKLDDKQLEKLYGDLVEVWKNTVQNEILATEGNSIENTPDGDIKVLISTLSLDDEKVKNILGKMAEVISKNDTIITQFAGSSEKFARDAAGQKENKQFMQEWAKNLPQEMEKAKDKYAVENLKLTAKIDRDSYIIDEALEGTIVLKTDGELRINFSARTTRWNINSGNVKVKVPEIKKEDLLDLSKIKNDGQSEKYYENFKKMFESSK